MIQITKTFKKYGNRKLYDSQESRYVNLADIAATIQQGFQVRVVTNGTGEDITEETLKSIVLGWSMNSTKRELYDIIQIGGGVVRLRQPKTNV